jgi:hypothetical protein
VEWDEQQQAHALALRLYRTMTCDGCGGWLPDTTTDADAELYRVPPPHRCGACTAVAMAMERHAQDHKHMQATRWRAERR